MALRRKVDRSALAELAKRASGRDSIINLGDRRLGLGVVEDGRNLMVRFRDAVRKTGVQEIDLNYLQSRPLLARAVADALAAWGVNARAATRQALCKDLAIFWRFLNDYGKSGPATGVQGVGDITTTVVNAYVAWLNISGLLTARNGATIRKARHLVLSGSLWILGEGFLATARSSPLICSFAFSYGRDESERSGLGRRFRMMSSGTLSRRALGK